MAQNVKDIQLRELKDFLSELRETNKLLRKTLEETQKEKAVLQKERDNFKEAEAEMDLAAEAAPLWKRLEPNLYA